MDEGLCSLLSEWQEQDGAADLLEDLLGDIGESSLAALLDAPGSTDGTAAAAEQGGTAAAAAAEHQELSDQAASSSGASASSARGSPTSRRRMPACQADGCTADLAPLATHLQRHRICLAHIKADSYLSKRVVSRYCQLCGQGHPLARFEGGRRCCRHSLERRTQRRRDKQEAAAAAEAASPGLLAAQAPFTPALHWQAMLPAPPAAPTLPLAQLPLAAPMLPLVQPPAPPMAGLLSEVLWVAVPLQALAQHAPHLLPVAIML